MFAVTRNPVQNKVVIGTISLSYLIYVVESGVQWYNAKRAFVDNGQTRQDVFVTLYRSPSEWYFFIRDVCYFLMAALADGLLVRKHNI